MQQKKKKKKKGCALLSCFLTAVDRAMQCKSFKYKITVLYCRLFPTFCACVLGCLMVCNKCSVFDISHTVSLQLFTACTWAVTLLRVDAISCWFVCKIVPCTRVRVEHVSVSVRLRCCVFRAGKQVSDVTRSRLLCFGIWIMEVKYFCQSQDTVGLGLTRKLKSDWLPVFSWPCIIVSNVMLQRVLLTRCCTSAVCVCVQDVPHYSLNWNALLHMNYLCK